MKFRNMIIVMAFIAIPLTLLTCYVFDKLNNYKLEIHRLHQYHSSVIKRQQEDIEILFKRLNKIDALQQHEEERLEKLEWLSTHRY